jgi:hypothetical protein
LLKLKNPDPRTIKNSEKMSHGFAWEQFMPVKNPVEGQPTHEWCDMRITHLCVNDADIVERELERREKDGIVRGIKKF